MPKASTKAKAAKRLKQQAIITITETGNGINVDLDFTPAVDGNAKMTPAVAAAMEMLIWFREEQARRNE